MEIIQCPYCREPIKAQAVLCKHCRSPLGSVDARGRRRVPYPETWWLPIPAILFGLLSLLGSWATTDISPTLEEMTGLILMPLMGIGLGLCGSLLQKKGRLTAIVGCAISAFALIVAILVLID